MLDAACDALAAYEELVRARVDAQAHPPGPAAAGDLETDFRRWMGAAIGHLETAGLVLDDAVARGEDALAWALAREAARLAHETLLQLVSHAPGASDALRRAAERALATWSDPSGADEDQVLRRIARERLGVEAG
jgi:hypothetical protein